MLKKLAIAGATGAVVLGAGTAAMAVTGSTPAPSPTVSAAAHPVAKADKADKAAKKHHKAMFDKAMHAQWVTGKAPTFVTHDAIRGTVTAVSATSISVKAADGVSETYTVSSTTKVGKRGAGKAQTGSIATVKVNDKAAVLGTGTTTLSASAVHDLTK